MKIARFAETLIVMALKGLDRGTQGPMAFTNYFPETDFDRYIKG
jgi:hypothetical protein